MTTEPDLDLDQIVDDDDDLPDPVDPSTIPTPEGDASQQENTEKDK